VNISLSPSHTIRSVRFIRLDLILFAISSEEYSCEALHYVIISVLPYITFRGSKFLLHHPVLKHLQPVFFGYNLSHTEEQII
jgi:hypothetical protein